MCNLYSQTRNTEAIRRLFKVSHNRAVDVEPKAAIFPANGAPVVRSAEDGERELVMMNWGFVLPQKGKASKRVTNARDEKVQSSRFWNKSFEERRCFVPVTSFSEPKGRQPAVWHWFALGDDRQLFAFAGLWRSFKGKLKADGDTVEMDTYAFLTTTPNSVVKPIHPHRMPVLLVGKEAHETWINGTSEEAIALAQPYPAKEMKIVAKGEKRDNNEI